MRSEVSPEAWFWFWLEVVGVVGFGAAVHFEWYGFAAGLGMALVLMAHSRRAEDSRELELRLADVVVRQLDHIQDKLDAVRAELR